MQATRLAKTTGKPVQVMRSREEEFFYDNFRPAAVMMRFQGGNVLTKNFDDYHLPRFPSMPQIDIVLIDNRQTNAPGGGEPPIICMGAVLANAIFDATGKRRMELPIQAAFAGWTA